MKERQQIIVWIYNGKRPDLTKSFGRMSQSACIDLDSRLLDAKIPFRLECNPLSTGNGSRIYSVVTVKDQKVFVKLLNAVRRDHS